MGGWVTERLERFPTDGEQVTIDGFDVTVTMETDQRIGCLAIKYTPETEKEDE